MFDLIAISFLAAMTASAGASFVFVLDRIAGPSAIFFCVVSVYVDTI